MDLGLQGKAALVAAASRGLGRAVAEELAAEGADLVLCARGAEDLESTRSAIEGRWGRRVVGVTADLAVHEEAERVAQVALRELGRVDILVTNGGGPPAGPFESHDLEAWRTAVRGTLESAWALIRAVLPGMKERGWGRIVNITSIAVKQPVDGLVLSNAVRAAVTGMARTLANEVAPFGVTVNNVLPGYTRTGRVEELADRTARARGSTADEVVAGWVREIPAGRLGEPPEFAAAVAFLASARASFITGQSLAVDGGWIRALH